MHENISQAEPKELVRGLSELPLVSVIVPVYNVLPYLREALDSTINQSYRNLEIVIIDDGSSDDSGGICDEFVMLDARLRVIHQKNRGLAASRNVGIDAAAGDWILFLDSDDWMERDAVEILEREVRLSDADVACCSYITEPHRRSTSTHEETHATLTGKEAVESLVCQGNIGNIAWGKLYRAGSFESIRYPEGRVYEDIATTWRVLDRVGIVVRVPDELFHYRMRDGSIAHSHDIANLVDYWLAYWERFEELSGRSQRIRRHLIEQCMFAIGRAWSWRLANSREERIAHSAALAEMATFISTYYREVLYGKYRLRTKVLVSVCSLPAPIAFVTLRTASFLRRLFLGEVCFHARPRDESPGTATVENIVDPTPNAFSKKR